jgi:N-acyl-phosphatidylethanolamine-hydrolysing phospholipase D
VLQFTDHKLTSGVHATPEQAVLIHRDIKSRHSLAMHFATFAGSDIEAFEPIVELTEIRDKHSIGDWHEEGGFGVIDIGETAMINIRDSGMDAMDASSS